MPIARIFSTITSAANQLKPHKSEATQRIRTNALCLGTTIVLSYLLPLPSLPTALKVVLSLSSQRRWSYESVWEWICVLETVFLSLLIYNIMEASYAIKYPRVSPPTAAERRQATVASTPQKRPFKILSPNSSPQAQKSFTFSPKAPLSRTLSSSTPAPNSKSTYAPSPLDTPSRVINYGPVLPSSTNTQASSTSDYLQTPSPVISAYRGKHSGGEIGHALDGSYLSRILPDTEGDEE